MPDPYILILTGFGFLVALVAWLPLVLRRAPLSLPIVCLSLGAVGFMLPGVSLRPMPFDFPTVAERATEFVVIIALMGAGLKLDRPFDWRGWRVTWRLLAVTMPISIAAIMIMGIYGLGLSLISSLLLAASLAPTDPVLAADVQVGPPKTGEEDEARFALTSEAGLNDGLAFPFVNLAIALSTAAATGEPWFWKWLGYNVVWEIAAGIAGGWLIGRAFGWVTFHMPGSRLAKTGDGLIALSATLVSYGLTEIIHCYGFLAVFVTALTLRASHRNHDLHDDMHDLVDQVERVSMMVILLLFGGSLALGLLAPLPWSDYLLAAAVILVVRPLAGMVGMIGLRATWGEKLTIAFFGIRGLGSFYYLAYGINHMEVADPQRLWGIVGLISFMSILLHGLTVTPAIRLLDRSHGRDPDAPAT